MTTEIVPISWWTRQRGLDKGFYGNNVNISSISRDIEQIIYGIRKVVSNKCQVDWSAVFI